MTDLKHAYSCQKSSAKERDIPFLLSFDAWLKIWVDSGHLHERGRKQGQYCMARFGDRGPYALGNVKIIQFGLNVSEGQLGRTKTLEIKFKMGIGWRGKKLPQFMIDRLRESKLGKKQSPEHAAKAAAAGIGLKRSEETKERMSKAWELRKASGWKPAFTNETRAKISAAGKGRKKSPEHQAKINASLAATRARKAAEGLKYHEQK